jgi:hypothetical protein
MKAWILGLPLVIGCESTEVDNTGGTVTLTIYECEAASSEALEANDAGADAEPSNVIATCDDQQPCTVDIQCTPCSAVPEAIRYIKATCTPDEELSPFCFDMESGALLYSGCTHFIQDPTPVGVTDACFPVKFPADPDSEAHSGVCSAMGVCVENPSAKCSAPTNALYVEPCR